MRACLLTINPELTAEPPLINLLVVNNQGQIVICGDHWAREVPCDTLEKVRVEDLHKPLHISAEEGFSLYLSAVRELPSDDLMSAPMLQWARQWWLDEVTDLVRRSCIETSPAVLTAA